MSQLLSQTHRANRGRARSALGNGKTDVSIIASEPPAVGTAGPIDSARSALIPAAVFIVVEIILVAEAISVILLKEIDLRNPAATPIAILLSMALLANLGIVCSMAAASAANSIRKPNTGNPHGRWLLNQRHQCRDLRLNPPRRIPPRHGPSWTAMPASG